MFQLLFLGTSSLGAAAVLLWSGARRTHKTAAALLAYHAGLMLALIFAPSIWSPAFFVVGNGLLCVLSAAVGLEAARRHGYFGVVSFDGLLLSGCAAVAGFMLVQYMPGHGQFRGMIAPYIAAAAVLSVTAQRVRTVGDVEATLLWGLALTRWLNALRFAVLEVGPAYSAWVGGMATVAWIAWTAMVCRHCFSADAESKLR